ncbi:hypothetical protein POM88_031523 [Heracleum sosnowskyi]|uniref:LisH domain-containing protein n=2 Tax=Heracleum sosnowskyi TaxID=360622 RepID=A0AAD8MGQ1_9APIA|nr:hypothetical protein POM88_031523 [Heracleum sosnowskyi]
MLDSPIQLVVVFGLVVNYNEGLLWIGIKSTIIHTGQSAAQLHGALGVKIVILKRMENGVKYMFLGKERGAEEMLHLYIYNYLKKRGLDEAAKTFAEEMLRLDCDDSLQKDWWYALWPELCSRMTKQPRWNLQSPAQSPLQEAVPVLESLRRYQPPQHVRNVVGHPAEEVSQALQDMNQLRAGKLPMNTDSASILGHPGSKEKGKGLLGFPPAKLLPSEITLVQHSRNSSYQQMPGGTIQPPQIVGPYQSVQLEPTYPARQDLTYPPAAAVVAAPVSGENKCRNQGSLMRIGVNAPDEPTPNSSRIQVPAVFFESMEQEAEQRERRE